MSKVYSWLEAAKDYLSFKTITNLRDFRSKVLTIAFSLMILTSLISLPYQLIVYGLRSLWVFAGANLIACLGLYFLKLGKVEYARIGGFGLFYILLTILVYNGWPSLRYYLVVLSLSSSAIIFLRSSTKYIWLEYLLVLSMIVAVLWYSNLFWFDITITVVAFNIFCYLIWSLIASLEKELTNKVESTTKLNDDLKFKNDQAQLYTNIMVHDIKAPLRSIKGFSQIIDKKIQKLDIEDNSIHSYFNYITKSIESLELLIDDLLVQAKVEQNPLNPESINLKEMIESQFDKLKYQIKESNTQIDLQNLSTIHADKRSISIVLNNLISNAIKYQPLKEDHHPLIKIAQIENKDSNIISIADNGIGIDEKYLGETFQPFKRFHSSSKFEGTGLGLSICKSIIERHQGTISISSKKDFGSEFTISLPKVIVESKLNRG